MNFSRCKTRRGGVARPCTLFTSRLHTRPHSVTIRFASGSLAIGRTVTSATATASDPPQAAIAAALLWELNALPFDHDTTTPLPQPASTKVAQIGSTRSCGFLRSVAALSTLLYFCGGGTQHHTRSSCNMLLRPSAALAVGALRTPWNVAGSATYSCRTGEHLV